MKTKHNIKELRGVSGLYIIINLKNNKKYIGASKDLYSRYKKHQKMLINKKHDNSHLQNSYNKYGEDFFEFRILKITLKDIVFNLEKRYIKEKNIVKSTMYYNMKEGGIGGFDLINKNISKIKKEQWNNKNSIYNTSEYKETLKRSRQEYMKKEDCVFKSDEFKNKKRKQSLEIWKNENFREKRLAELQKGTKVQLSKNGKIINVFKSIAECARFLKRDRSGLRKHIMNKQRLKVLDEYEFKLL